jgi:ankyrin repeat protein
MKYLRLFEDFESHDPYELMIIPPNKKSEMIMKEIEEKKPNLNLVQDLITFGANLDWQDKDGSTLLIKAEWYHKPEIMRMLIDEGADMNIQTNFLVGGITALHSASVDNNITVAQMLIDAGADLNLQDNRGWTALHYAVERGLPKLSKMLIGAGADLNVQDDEGMTALHWAVGDNDFKSSKMLIDAGADIYLQDNAGKTPYDLAQTEEIRTILKP